MPPASSTRSSKTPSSVVQPRDQLVAAHDPLRLAGDAHLVSRVARVEHLVAGNDSDRIVAGGNDDPRPARRLGAGRDDEARRGLRLFVDRLDQDVLVQRLEPTGESLGVLEPAERVILVHGVTLAGAPALLPAAVRTASSRSSSANGFSRNATAPSPAARRRDCSSASTENITVRVRSCSRSISPSSW